MSELIEKNRYVIIGSGIAGMAAAEAIRRIDPNASINMITGEKDLCFNRPMLVHEFALDGSGSRLFEQQEDWPIQQGIELIRGVSVKTIQPETKTVCLHDGRTIEYDRLIYATGADAEILPIPGADRGNVFTVRTRADMRRIREAMGHSKRAVIIGGGMLGLEDAWAMRAQKMEVSIIEQRQRLAFAQIDQSAGNLIKKRVERWGVSVYVDARVEEIGDGFVLFIDESGKLRRIPADMVILSTGVVPNSDLGASAGLKTTGGSAGREWILVDEHCRTSERNIFAAGDVAAVNGRNDAIWDEAREMGRIAGTNAAIDVMEEKGLEIEAHRPTYTPVVPEHVFNGFDTEIFTLGDSSGAGTDGVYIRHADVEIFDYQRERYIRVSLQDGVIAGILLINVPELVPELMAAYEKGAGEEEARHIILKWREDHDVDFKPASPFRRR